MDYTLLDREHDSVAKRKADGELDPASLSVGELIARQDSWTFDSPAHAKRYERNLRDALTKLKALIEDCTQVPPAATFEL